MKTLLLQLLFLCSLPCVGQGSLIFVDEFTFIDGGGLKTTSNASQLDLNANASANVQSITAGGIIYSNLIFPSAVTGIGALGADLVGANASRGVANQLTFDVTFAASPVSVANDFLILSDIGGAEDFEVQLLNGSSVEIGNKLSFSTATWTDIADGVQFGVSNTVNDDVSMVIMNLSDFGSVTATEIEGVRIFNIGNGLDPFIVGLAVVPEPSTTAILGLFGVLALLRRKRRKYL